VKPRSDELPKGMMPEHSEAPAERSAPLTCERGNYAGAIRLALAGLPVEVRVDRLLVLERDGRPPQVRLSLSILGEKGGEGGERRDRDVQP